MEGKALRTDYIVLECNRVEFICSPEMTGCVVSSVSGVSCMKNVLPSPSPSDSAHRAPT